METIISPVDRALIEKELNDDRFIRDTNNAANKIFVITHHDSPNTMREIGRLREMTFRDAGGGTGKAIDIDQYDTDEVPFKQLIVWDPNEREIIGGYRFIHGKDISIRDDGSLRTPTGKLFNISEKFIKEYMPVTVELGRSFVQTFYQPTVDLRRGMYSRDNIWDGLGAIIIDNSDIKFLFGKVTLYPHYDALAKDLLYYFISKYFPDKEKLMTPIKPVVVNTPEKVLKSIFTGCNYDEDYRILVHKIRGLKEGVPPLFNAYMNLSATMRSFGAAVNPTFGGVEEMGIIVTIEDIHDYKKDRHISSYLKEDEEK
ncbi:MAG: GNAT family N-acetyltransferase [Bacteroidetes bacterium]|nr:GNAT family N-acetyltransferase [Bacteroidota bacterium]